MTTERTQIAIGKSLGVLGRLRECGITRFRVCVRLLNRLRHEQIAEEDAVVPDFVDEFCRSAEPARCRRIGAAMEQAECEPEGTTGRSFAIVAREKLLMPAYANSLADGVVSNQVSSGGEPIEILRSQRRFMIGRLQLPKRITPGVALKGLSALRQRVVCRHFTILEVSIKGGLWR